MTRLPKTVPPEYDNPLPTPAAEEDWEAEQDQASAVETQRKVALEAWKMGRRLRASRRGVRVPRIPRMHPGTWRSGR
jgi:hypothetical protein